MINSVINKNYAFALQVIQLYKDLAAQNEYVPSKQLLKSGTSIGANLEEALAGKSCADVLSKLSIASKEARETNYWLRLLRDSKILNASALKDIVSEADEISNMLTAIVKTSSSRK